MAYENEDGLWDDAQEREEVDDKELINYVKMNPFLYNKAEKLYSDTEVKRLSWAAIGNRLSKKKSGPETEHRFLLLRQRFVKERKKVREYKPRSGAGADHQIYTPKWELYHDLMFLADVIKHRNTTSNYKRKLPAHKVTLYNDTDMNCPSTSTSSYSLCTSSVWNEDLAVFPSNRIFGDSEHSNVTETSVYSPQEPLSQPATVLSIEHNKENTPVKQIQQVMTSACKKIVSVPDSFARSKKLKADTFNKSILEQSKSLNILAQKVGDALTTPCTLESVPVKPHIPELPSSFSQDTKAMLSSIGFALQKVPESNQLDCLISVIQSIRQFIE